MLTLPVDTAAEDSVEEAKTDGNPVDKNPVEVVRASEELSNRLSDEDWLYGAAEELKEHPLPLTVTYDVMVPLVIGLVTVGLVTVVVMTVSVLVCVVVSLVMTVVGRTQLEAHAALAAPMEKAPITKILVRESPPIVESPRQK